MFDSIGDLFGGFALLICGFLVLAVLMVGMFFRNRRRADGGTLGHYGHPAQTQRPDSTTPRPSGPVVRPQYDDRDVVSGGGFGAPARPRPNAREGAESGGLFALDEGREGREDAGSRPTGGFGTPARPAPRRDETPRRDDDVSSSGGFGTR